MRRWHDVWAHLYEWRRQLNPYVLFAGLLAWAALSLSGFSTMRRTFLSDQAFVDSAIVRVMQAYPPPLRLGAAGDVTGGATPEDVVPYHDVGEFRAVNPACCAFVAGDTEGTGPSPLSYLIGDEWRVVRVRYQVRFREGRVARPPVLVTEFLMLGRDGRVVWRH